MITKNENVLKFILEKYSWPSRVSSDLTSWPLNIIMSSSLFVNLIHKIKLFEFLPQDMLHILTQKFHDTRTKFNLSMLENCKERYI